MEKEIKVVVRVNSQEHAKLIKDEIVTVLNNRTTIYYVSSPFIPVKYVDQLIEEELTESGLLPSEPKKQVNNSKTKK